MRKEHEYKRAYLLYGLKHLQELLAPVVQTLVAIGGLFRIGVAGVLHPIFEKVGVFFQDQVLAQHGVCLEFGE